MSVERLGGLVMRAAAPLGHVPAAGLMPAFDAPAAVATAALETGLAAVPAMPPSLRRRGGATTVVPAVQHAATPELALAIPVRTAAAKPATVAAGDMPAHAPPPARHDTRQPIIRQPEDSPHFAAPSPSRTAMVRPAGVELAPVVMEPVIAAPTPENAAAGLEGSVDEPPSPERVQVVASAAPQPAGEHPVQATASIPDPAPSNATPTVTIGTVEVVIAPPPAAAPQRAAAAARPAHDRGFARYAAMRAARDRAW